VAKEGHRTEERKADDRRVNVLEAPANTVISPATALDLEADLPADPEFADRHEHRAGSSGGEQLREVRLCATLAGSPPLLVTAWLRDLGGLHGFEMALAGASPVVRVVERLVTLRTVKRMGRLLDADGCAVGAVPTDVWAPPV